MTDNISIRKIWQDNDLMQVTLSCSGRGILAVSDIYVSSCAINDLYEKMILVCGAKIKDFLWENSKHDLHFTPTASVRFISSDSCGHIILEVYMQIDDSNGTVDHHCCFYIKTEIGLLQEFAYKLKGLTNSEIGCVFSLI